MNSTTDSPTRINHPDAEALIEELVSIIAHARDRCTPDSSYTLLAATVMALSRRGFIFEDILPYFIVEES